MNSKSLDQEIRSRIDAFLSDVTLLLKRAALESVRAALGEAGRARRGPGRPPLGSGGRKRGGKRGKRSSAEVADMAERVLEYVRKNDGSRLEEISRGMGLASQELKLPVAKLLDGRQVRTTGRKRGTKYHAGKGGAKKRGARRKR
jgi:hypothetical protein